MMNLWLRFKIWRNDRATRKFNESCWAETVEEMSHYTMKEWRSGGDSE